MTHLIASITVGTVRDADVRATEARRQGADAIELRVDGCGGLAADLNRLLQSRPDDPWIVTCRSRGEGGQSDATPDQRAAFVAEIVRGTNAFVDFEFADWRASPGVRDAIQRAVTTVGGRKRVILSAHNFNAPFDDRQQLIADMLADPTASVVKIAYHAGNAADSFAALDLMRSYGNRVCAIAMGSCGLWTRMLARKFNAWGTYGALDADSATSPGQLTVSDMIEQFRWASINPATDIFGVIGDPVAHSMSPLVFNDWFEAHDVDAVYLPMHVPGDEGALAAFLDAVRARPWLNLRGLSVTLPHKKAALNWCGGGADSMARSIGAANTVAFDATRPRAFNTDCYAAIDSLCAALHCRRYDLAAIRVDVLGAGGVARAIVYGLREYGCRGTIYGRTIERATSLADEFGFESARWDQRNCRAGDVTINATSVGMWPDVAASPLSSDALDGCRLVFDTIYNPTETTLLSQARAKGIATRNGLGMFVRQAAMQFELWTGKRPDIGRAAALVADRLANTPPASEPGCCASPLSAGRHRGVPPASIVLIGLRGAGKTTVGRMLARRLGASFVDTDERIATDAGKSIADIFAGEGEAGFRRRERDMVTGVIAERPGVISVGGGAVLDPANVDGLKQAGPIVWLTAPPAILWERVAADAASASTRPPLSSRTGPDEMEQLSRDRAAAYEGAATITIDTTGQSPEQVTFQILTALGLSEP